jgi:hypothetical protein
MGNTAAGHSHHYRGMVSFVYVVTCPPSLCNAGMLGLVLGYKSRHTGQVKVQMAGGIPKSVVTSKEHVSECLCQRKLLVSKGRLLPVKLSRVLMGRWQRVTNTYRPNQWSTHEYAPYTSYLFVIPGNEGAYGTCNMTWTFPPSMHWPPHQTL